MLDIKRRTRRQSSPKLLFFDGRNSKIRISLFSIPWPCQINSLICWHTKHIIINVSLSIYPMVRSNNEIGVNSQLLHGVPPPSVLNISLMDADDRAVTAVAIVVIASSSNNSSASPSSSSSFTSLRSTLPIVSQLLPLLRRRLLVWWCYSCDVYSVVLIITTRLNLNDK